MSETKRSSSLNLWFYLAFALITLGLLGWSFMRLLRETPTREVAVELPGQGLVTVSLTTDPFPPLPSGTVEISLQAQNTRGVMVDIGPSVAYFLRDPNDETTLRSGVLPWEPNRGMYLTGVQFPTPGNYWLVFELDSGQQVRFQVYVEPAQ